MNVVSEEKNDPENDRARHAENFPLPARTPKRDNPGISPSKWRVGLHTSIAGSLDQAAERAQRLGCTAFQIFSTSPRMWKQREPSADEIASLRSFRQKYDLNPLVIHANYLLNLASSDPELRRRSVEAFRGEVLRAAALGAEYLVLHPGSYRGASAGQGVRTLAASIREAVQEAPLDGVTLLVENTCGQGNILGGNFAELRDILGLLEGISVRCCVDTAHCFAAGMDVASEEGLESMLESLDATVGLGRVPVIHTNDSRSPLGSHRDRHEHIGKGGIGREGFRRIVNHPALRDKVFILETPLEAEGDDRRNMKTIRTLREEKLRIAVPRLLKKNSRITQPVRMTGRVCVSELQTSAAKAALKSQHLRHD
ncbi:MAG: deoxyribonuclease IV [Acidobacteria bacterium]|nr:deoxyribonuclease IV [Acidobacteriota bacterium]